MKKKKIIFITGTRADFGKIKPLLAALKTEQSFETYLFVTGMHMNPKYGHTVHEVKKSGFTNRYCFINGKDGDTLDEILKNTISGFGQFVRMEKPDLIVVHGDRVEALAGALVGSLNNVLVAHIEGGEVSGTIDEHIRHSISKMAHLHFVSNQVAKNRLIQLGEDKRSIFVIGSPDLDVMASSHLPNFEQVQKRYKIPTGKYGLFTFHPVTTEIDTLRDQVNAVIDALIASNLPYIGVYPNNDPGTEIVFDVLKERLFNSKQYRFFPSVRFEYFLTMIKHASFVVGNSSVGIREAPFYGVPSINIGTRQNRRDSFSNINTIYHAEPDTAAILKAINLAQIEKKKQRKKSVTHFGRGNSSQLFLKVVSDPSFWQKNPQKQFYDIV